MRRIRLEMMRRDLLDIPEVLLPEGFQIRLFRKGDERNWAKVEASVGEFISEESALAHFDREFGSHLDEMQKRCLFIENRDGEVIATTTAWYGDFKGDGGDWGRIHWVAVDPRYQGRKLSKPLVSTAMKILLQYHDKAYLTTQTTSYQAINLYLNYGFTPNPTSESCNEGWKWVEQKLNRTF